MTTFLLIRHGANDYLGKALAGRLAGVHLNELGREQAEWLADWLAGEPIGAIYSSPLERARETAAPLARRLGLPVETAPELQEIDFGDWTGKTFEELALLPLWHQFNAIRSSTRIPGGEHMRDAQSRVTGYLERLAESHPGHVLALFGHADPIKSAIAYYLGVSLDLFHRLEISPASVSRLVLGDGGPHVLDVNRTTE